MTTDDAIEGEFVDELDPNEGRMNTEVFPECSFMCLDVLQEGGIE